MGISGNDSPISIVVYSGFLELKLETVRSQFYTFDPSVLFNWNTIFVPG